MDTNLTLPQLHAVGLLEMVQGSCGDGLPFGENTTPQMVTDWIAQSDTIYQDQLSFVSERMICFFLSFCYSLIASLAKFMLDVLVLQ